MTIRNTSYFADIEAATNGRLRVYMGRALKSGELAKELMFEIQLGACIVGTHCNDDIFKQTII
jgi:hypothetical protein